MGRGFSSDIVTLVVLAAGGYLIYTKTDWFQQGLAAVKEFIGEVKGGISSGGGGSSVGGGAGRNSGSISSEGTCTGTPLTRDTSNGREEWESKNVPWDAYEVTWCGTFSGDDLTFKLYGPSHNGSACCWCVLHVKEDGQMVPGGEGPHPSSNCQHPAGSNGKKGKASCYKAVIRPGPIQEGYALVNGQWELRASYKGPCGCSKTSNTKTGNTLMVRNDGTANTKCASVKGLSSSAYTSAGQYTSSLFTNNRPYSQPKILNVI